MERFKSKLCFKSLEDDIQRSSVTNMLELDVDSEGETTDISEPMNTLMKRFSKWKECQRDEKVLSLYRLSLYFDIEIDRGFRNMGDLTVKEEYMHL